MRNCALQNCGRKSPASNWNRRRLSHAIASAIRLTTPPKKANRAELAMAEFALPANGRLSEAGGGTPDEARTTKWDFPIYSPIDGRVLRVMQENSAVVMPGTALVELGDPFDLEVAVDVLSRRRKS